MTKEELTTEEREVYDIAKRNRLTADDLLTEAECVEEYTEWQHMCLMGYFEDTLRAVADVLKNEQSNK